MAQKPTSFKKVQAMVAFNRENAFPKCSAPPIAISPRGVAVFPRLFTVVFKITWKRQNQHRPDKAYKNAKDNGICGNSF